MTSAEDDRERSGLSCTWGKHLTTWPWKQSRARDMVWKKQCTTLHPVHGSVVISGKDWPDWGNLTHSTSGHYYNCASSSRMTDKLHGTQVFHKLRDTSLKHREKKITYRQIRMKANLLHIVYTKKKKTKKPCWKHVLFSSLLLKPNFRYVSYQKPTEKHAQNRLCLRLWWYDFHFWTSRQAQTDKANIFPFNETYHMHEDPQTQTSSVP